MLLIQENQTFLFIVLSTYPSLIVLVNFAGFVIERGKNHHGHGSQFKSSQFGISFSFPFFSFFLLSPFVAWETGNVMGRTWGLLWGWPLLAWWKAHSSHFSHWIVLRPLFSVAFSLQRCTRQSLRMKLFFCHSSVSRWAILSRWIVCVCLCFWGEKQCPSFCPIHEHKSAYTEERGSCGFS